MFLLLVPAANLALASAHDYKVSTVRYYTVPGVKPQLLSLDVHYRQGGRRLPVLIYVHGGAWFTGGKNEKSIRRAAKRFVAEGYVFVSVNYRLSPAVKHPAQVQDVARAVAWVGRTIGAYGGDSRKLFLLGHSAGAHLASLVTIDRRYLAAARVDPRSIRGVIAIDTSAYDLKALYDGVAPARAQRVRKNLRRVFGATPAELREASPITHIKSGEYIPPFLLVFTGAKSMSHRQAIAMSERLRAVARTGEVYYAKYRNHGSVKERLGGVDDRTTSKILDFMSRN